MLLRISVLALVLFTPACAAADVAHKDNIRIATDRITDTMIQEGVPAVSAAVAIDGELVWSDGFGAANKATGAAAGGDTAHSIASISKPFTAMAVMSLVEAGVLDLDAPVNDYLGDQKLTARLGDADNVTLRLLLNHTSGLPGHHSFFYEDEDQRRLAYDESIRQFGVLVNPPGEIFEYSNYGFGIVEYVIERETGQPFAEVIAERVIEPLGLENTFLPTANPEKGNVAVRYRNTGEAVPFFDFYHRGAAAMYSSPEDLVRFGLAYADALNGDSSLLASASAQEMIADPAEISTFPWAFGLGWQIREVNGHRLVTHAGGMPGTRSRLVVAPDDGVAIAVALNADTMIYEDIVSMLTQVFAPHLQDQANAEAIAEAMGGDWVGAADLGEYGSLPIALSIPESGEMTAVLNGVPIRLDEIMIGRQGYFHIVFHDGSIPTPLAARYPHRISLKIRKRDDRLTGYILTEGRPQADRIGSALGYWVEMRPSAKL